MTEFYPMPMFVKLYVEDIDRSIQWYKQALGFESVFELPGSHGKIVLAHLRGKKYQDIMLLPLESTIENKGNGIVINFATDDIDKLAERAQRAEAEIIEGPINRPWNTRELLLLDKDGYTISFSQVIDENIPFEEVMPPRTVC